VSFVVRAQKTEKEMSKKVAGAVLIGLATDIVFSLGGSRLFWFLLKNYMGAEGDYDRFAQIHPVLTTSAVVFGTFIIPLIGVAIGGLVAGLITPKNKVWCALAVGALSGLLSFALVALSDSTEKHYMSLFLVVFLGIPSAVVGGVVAKLRKRSNAP
jgi:hypothetical protein